MEKLSFFQSTPFFAVFWLIVSNYEFHFGHEKTQRACHGMLHSPAKTTPKHIFVYRIPKIHLSWVAEGDDVLLDLR